MKKIIFIMGILIAVLAIAYIANKKYTKSFSPEDHVTYNASGLNISIDYCQPSKKGRLIFGNKDDGALVPFGEVWRTGANEATEIEFSTDVVIAGSPLPAGRYTLFTIPGEAEWTIIFNKELDQWGAFFYSETEDILRVTAPSRSVEQVAEAFTIRFHDTKGLQMKLLWDSTEVSLPIEIKNT